MGRSVVELVEEPQPLLRERERHFAIDQAGDGCGAGLRLRQLPGNAELKLHLIRTTHLQPALR